MDTERLWLRPLARGDGGEFRRLCLDDLVRRDLLGGSDASESWCREVIAESEARVRRGTLGMYLVGRNGEGAAVGFAGFRLLHQMGQEPQLLYAFVQEATGRGYATEVVRALTEAALAKREFRRVVATVEDDNPASARVLKKNGFRETPGRPGAFGLGRLYVRYR